MLEVLLKLKRYEFELNLNKCQFFRRKIEYLGYVVSENGITLRERHTKAISGFPQPRNVHEVQRFLGLTGYFRKFIANYAGLAKPLYSLFKKNANFDFSEKCVRAFNELIAYPVLRLYNLTVKTQLHTDANASRIGAILVQKQGNGSWVPIVYYSQAETNNHSYELKMLAIVKSVERFHIYLYGLEFMIITYCNALV